MIFDQLFQHLDECSKKKEYAKLENTIKSIQAKLDEYWKILKDNAIICAILDPRLKCEFITDKKERASAIRLLKKLFETYSNHIENAPPQSDNLESNSNSIRPLNMFQRFLQKVRSSVNSHF